jgi:MarR family transcriptional regulator, organic hydroperoxide resistance regulator
MALKARNNRIQRPLAPIGAEPLTVSRPELLSNKTDANFRALVHGLISLGRRIITIRDGLGTLAGMSGVQFEIMMLVSRLGGQTGVTVTEISDLMLQSGAFTTIEVGKLVEKGLLEKSADQQDRRRVRLRLTEQGRKTLADVAPHQQQVNDILFGSLDSRDFHELSRILRELVPSFEHGTDLMEFMLKRESARTTRNGG